MALKVLYKPADELLAVRIKDLLEQQGISAMLRSYQMPWYDGLAKMMRPEWGEVMVADQDFDRAREILEGLLAVIGPEADASEPEDLAPEQGDESSLDSGN